MQHMFSKLGLTQQFALVCAALCLVVSMTAVAIANFSSRYIVQQQRDDLGQQLITHIAEEISPDLASGDLLLLEAALRKALNDHGLQSLMVLDVDLREIGAAGVETGATDRAFRKSIIIDQHIAGELILELAPDRAAQEQGRMGFGLFFLALILSLFAAALAALWSQRVTQRIHAVAEKLQLEPEPEHQPQGNEISLLERHVDALPLDLLKRSDGISRSTIDNAASGLLFIRLHSLASYVDTLDETSLLRFTDMQGKLIQDAAGLYEGKLVVARQFGLLLTFSGDHSSGSPAFRAASTAWLIQEQALRLQPKMRLKLSISMAIGLNEAGDGSGDIYPELYGQHVIDELAAYTSAEVTGIPLLAGAEADPDLCSRCALQATEKGVAELSGFEQPFADLLERQLQLLSRQPHKEP